MSYDLLLLPRAQKKLSRLPLKEYERMRDILAGLVADPRPGGCKKLIDREGWRVRSGNYRAIYKIDDAARTITVLDIGDRKDVY